MNRYILFSGFGMALLLAATTVSVRAEEGGASQTRSQDRIHTQMNFQLPSSDLGQSQGRSEYTVMSQHQKQNHNQYQYKYMKQNKAGNSVTSSMDDINTSSRFMQGSSNTGSTSRQNFTGRSAGAGRR